MKTFDLVIRGGSVVDGTGAPAATADVAIADGRIVEVGRVAGPAAREIDASGATVAPGFVDIHTHYDAQATWDHALAPSSWHGVTSVVMGNCGVGFAPVRSADHDRLIELMEGVEDIPGTVLHEGITWEWESFTDYLDRLAEREYLIDVATYVPHSALRVYVMGDAGARREPSTLHEIEEMGRLVAEGVAAGALGFSTSQHLNHKSKDGSVIPSFGARAEELIGIARAMGTTGAGVLQMVTDFDDVDEDLALAEAMSKASGRPVSMSLAQFVSDPDRWRAVLAGMGALREAGVPVKAQVAARAIGMILGLQCTRHPLDTNPVFAEIADKPLAEKVAIMRDPAFRQRVLSTESDASLAKTMAHWDMSRFNLLFELDDTPDFEPEPSESIGARAIREGRAPLELVYDVLLQDEGTGMLYLPFVNYAEGDLSAVHDMLLDPSTLPGLSDGGAHVGAICDASFPTTLLTHWGRDRSRGPRIPIETLVRRQCHDTAAAVGLHDRGVIAPGYRADLNVIDLERLRVHKPEIHFDLPAGGRRLMQRADGYVHTFVAGQEIRAGGEETGATPGRLVRGGQSGPDHPSQER